MDNSNSSSSEALLIAQEAYVRAISKNNSSLLVVATSTRPSSLSISRDAYAKAMDKNNGLSAAAASSVVSMTMPSVAKNKIEELFPIDFPTGRLGVPSDHPRIVLLKTLVAKSAAEHQVADKMGPRKYCNQVLRSRLEIVTGIVNQVKPAGGGKFKRRLQKNGPWSLDAGYTLMDLRSRVSSALCKHPNAKRAAIKAAALLEEQLSSLDALADENKPADQDAVNNNSSANSETNGSDETTDDATPNANSLAILSWVASEVSSAGDEPSSIPSRLKGK